MIKFVETMVNAVTLTVLFGGQQVLAGHYHDAKGELHLRMRPDGHFKIM